MTGFITLSVFHSLMPLLFKKAAVTGKVTFHTVFSITCSTLVQNTPNQSQMGTTNIAPELLITA